MPLNKSTGNMYDFVTHTWNTVKGKCPHDCSYCYMKRFPQSALHFDWRELKTDKAEIGLHGLIDAALKYVFDRVDWTQAQEAATGNQGAASATGFRGAASATGAEGVAVALGIAGRVRGAIGAFLVAAEWQERDDGWHRIAVRTTQVDGKVIKPDAWYSLQGGAFVEVE